MAFVYILAWIGGGYLLWLLSRIAQRIYKICGSLGSILADRKENGYLGEVKYRVRRLEQQTETYSLDLKDIQSEIEFLKRR